MAAKGRSRIAEVYVQVVPEVSNLTPSLTGQINSALASPQVSQATQHAGEQVGQNIGDSAGSTAGHSIGKAMLSGLAAAGLGEFLKGEIEKVLDNGEIESSMKAQLGLTAKQMENVAGASKELLKGNYAANYEAASESMKSIVSSVEGARNMTKEQLTLMGRDMSNLTQEYGVSSEDISKAVQTMIGSGLAKDVPDAMSAILAGFQNFGASGTDWLDSLSEFSNGFKFVGINGKESINLVSEAIKHGIKDTDAFSDAMKEFSMLMQAGGEQYDGAISALGLDPKKVKAEFAKGGDTAKKEMLVLTDKLQKVGDPNLWTAIFGPKAQEYMSTFQSMDWHAMEKALDPAKAGDLNKFDENLTTTADLLMGLKNTIDLAFTDTLAPVVKAAAPYLKQFADFIAQNKDAAAALAVVVGGVLIASVAALTVALWGLVAPVVANPATWLLAGTLAAVVALGAGIWWLSSNWEQVNTWMSQTWGGFIGFLEDSSGNIYQTFEDMGKGISKFFQEATVNVINSINDMIKALNNIKWDAPDWLGGNFGGLNIPLMDVPSFGSGGTIAPTPGGSIIRVAEKSKPESIVDTGVVNKNLELTNDRLDKQGTTGGGLHVTFVMQPGESIDEVFRKLKDYKDLHGETL